jgi:hypothetical protein
MEQTRIPICKKSAATSCQTSSSLEYLLVVKVILFFEVNPIKAASF